MITASEPIFAVADVRETVKYYREVLGFDREWLWCDHINGVPTFGGVGLGAAHVLLSLSPELQRKIEGHGHWFHVGDAQAMYEQHRAAGAQIVSDIGNKPWGFREYTVRDINGYHLRFASPVTHERPATGADTLPPHIRLEMRKPTLDEYVSLTKAVDWPVDLGTMPGALEQSVFGVVATDTRDGCTVGMLRVCGDGRYYTIWDVIVVPTYQGQKIGTEMMKQALDELRRRGPKGAFVGLFTGKRGFYQRLGFGDGGMCRSI
jgi:ribosomal protein S18 acetylase RimI-like enzyme